MIMLPSVRAALDDVAAPGRILLAAWMVVAGCAREGQDASMRAAGEPTEAVAPDPAAFAGDTACAGCHEAIAADFQATNKHRSVAPFRAETAPEALDEPTPVYNAATDLWYEAFRRGDTLFQREYRTDAGGAVVHDRTHPAALVVGSGNATRSYLQDVGGFLTEMPLTWYAGRRRWDMSPGYEEANDRFGRRINQSCITCHSDRPRHSPGTQNHYAEEPTGIGCERCHGPAAGHVRARRAGWDPGEGAPDTTVVDPSALDRGRQLAVCQQCHLAGVMVFRTGQDPSTFRPGQELVENRTVFVPSEQLEDPEWVGIDSHPLRLARSACYRGSDMTCSSCHDPHRSGDALDAGHYRSACLSCHGTSGDDPPAHGSCSRHDADTPAAAESGECTSCHMVQGGTSDVPHVTFTDHWIRRRPGPPRDPDRGRPALESPDPIPLVALQAVGRSSADLRARPSATALDRLEVAAAYWTFYETMHRHGSYPGRIVRLAREGLAGGADLLEARVALGRALADMDSSEAAESVFREATARADGDPWPHFWLGSVLEESGRPGEAVAPLTEAVRLQPLFMEARVKLAESLYRSGRTGAARAELREVVARDSLRWPRAWFNLGVIDGEEGRDGASLDAFGRASHLDPDFIAAHVRHGTALMAAGDLDGAEAAFRRATVADPDDVSALGSMAVLSLRRGDEGRARELLERVLEIDPSNQAARRLLAEIG